MIAGWVLGIVGVVAMGVLLDIVLPEGETNKYIKGIFSIVVVFAIITPLPKLLDKDFDINSILGVNEIVVNDSAINAIYEDREKNLSIALNDYIAKSKDETVKNVSLEYVDIQLDSKYSIENVVAKVKCGINEETLNINIVDGLKNFIAVYLNISKGKVTIL